MALSICLFRAPIAEVSLVGSRYRRATALATLQQPRFDGSGCQASHDEARLVALAIDFAPVVLGDEIDGHRECRLALEDFCRVRGGRDFVAHLRESGRKKGMMSVVRLGDPGESLSSFGVFLGGIAGAPEVTQNRSGW